LNTGAWVKVHTVYKDKDPKQKKYIEDKLLFKNKAMLVITKAVNVKTGSQINIGGFINRDCEKNDTYVADYSFLPPVYQNS
jgi:hypothetical protein